MCHSCHKMWIACRPLLFRQQPLLSFACGLAVGQSLAAAWGTSHRQSHLLRGGSWRQAAAHGAASAARYASRIAFVEIAAGSRFAKTSARALTQAAICDTHPPGTELGNRRIADWHLSAWVPGITRQSCCMHKNCSAADSCEYLY
jgi:hypothetical protein